MGNIYAILFMVSTILTILPSECKKTKTSKDAKCGPNNFVCLTNKTLRLCTDKKPNGPTFQCPNNTFCNTESADICDKQYKYIDTNNLSASTYRCLRYQRFADTTVSGCQSYILCLPNKTHFVGMKMKCSGNSIFSTKSNTCTAVNQIKACPDEDVNATSSKIRIDDTSKSAGRPLRVKPETTFRKHTSPSIDCSSYNFRLPSEPGDNNTTFLCPRKSINNGATHCIIFSNNFCLTLRKVNDIDSENDNPRRRPRTKDNSSFD